MREYGLQQSLFELLSPKYPFTSAKIAEYFVREKGSNNGDVHIIPASIKSG
jgi:hypothetical protein